MIMYTVLLLFKDLICRHDGGDIVSSYREMNEGIIEEPSIAEHTGREKLWKRHSLENDVPTDESPIGYDNN